MIKIMKNSKLILPLMFSAFLMFSCNNGNSTAGTSPAMDSSSTNPTSNASDYHPDQRQEIPVTDSSNTIGTDTLNSSSSAPNTGTNKSYLDAKGNKSDSSKKHK